MSSTFRLGIIGGCLSHQEGIPLNQLYQRQLGKMLFDQTSTRLKPQIARDFSQNYQARLESLLVNHRVDGVLLHMRVAAASKSTLFVRRSADGSAHYHLHPFFLNRRNLGWAEVMSDSIEFPALIRRPANRDRHSKRRNAPHIAGFRINDLNLLLGHLVGLDEWAIRDELAMLQCFVDSCQARELPFAVMSPTAVAGPAVVNRLVNKLDQQVTTMLKTVNAPHCAVNRATNERGQSILLPDGHHLNQRGHRYVAEQLLPIIARWAKQDFPGRRSRQQRLSSPTLN